MFKICRTNNVQREIFSLILIFPLSLPLSTGQLVWANSTQGETDCKWRRVGKKPMGQNNLINSILNEWINIKRKSLQLHLWFSSVLTFFIRHAALLENRMALSLTKSFGHNLRARLYDLMANSYSCFLKKSFPSSFCTCASLLLSLKYQTRRLTYSKKYEPPISSHLSAMDIHILNCTNITFIYCEPCEVTEIVVTTEYLRHSHILTVL